MRHLRKLLSFILLMACPLLHADDWTRWRGPQGNGLSKETRWNPDNLNGESILWRAEVGKGHAAVAVKGNRVYTLGETTTLTGTDTLVKDVIWCLNANTGKTLWQHVYPGKSETWPGPGATPVWDDGRVYTLSRRGHAFCLDANSGKVIWTRNLVSEGLAKVPQWGFSGSVLIEGDMAVYNAGLSGLALNKKTGKIIWQSAPETGGLATPVLWVQGGRKQLVINGNKTIYGIKLRSGEVAWTLDWDSYTDPLFVGNRFFNSTNVGGLGYFEVNGAQADTVWHTKNPRSYTWNNFITINKRLYGLIQIGRDFHLACLDLETGTVFWSEPVGRWGALIGAGHRLLFIDGDGDLRIIKATAESYQPLTELKIWDLGDWEKYPRGMPNVCWTNPVLANGKLYLRTTYGQLACIALK